MHVPELPPPQLAPWNEPVPEDWVLPSVQDAELILNEQRVGKFVQPGHLALLSPAERITEDDRTSGRLDEWKEAMSLAAGVGRSARIVVGIAAPQVGIPKRLIGVNRGFVDDPDSNQIVFFENPHIEPDLTKGIYEDLEGCLSCLRVAALTPRAVAATVYADNIAKPLVLRDTPGDRQKSQVRIFSHEIDHLNGILIIFRALAANRNPALRHPHRLTWYHKEQMGPYGEHTRAYRRGEVDDIWRNFVPEGEARAIMFGKVVLTGQSLAA